MGIFSLFFKDTNAKVIESFLPAVDGINRLEEACAKLSNEDFKNKTDELKQRLAGGGSLNDILTFAFALVREASRRTVGMRHYDVQLMGGIVLNKGEIAEMKTGEGKTLVASLSLYLNALEGKGCHLITVNDYLAKRDCGWNGPISFLLGVSTACIIHEQAFIFDKNYINENEKDERLVHLKPCTRKEAYQADITYGTNSEFGFDYLRDNMVGSLDDKVQRDLHYAIVDEVDSILIDEARTPLIISAPAEESAGLYKKFAQLVPRLKEGEDYNIDEKMRASTLTEEGLEKVEKWLGMGNIYTEGGMQMAHHLEQALKAHSLYKIDKDYVVKDGEVIIIDEFTGRLMHGRRYSEGLHQAIEAKENVDVQKESRTLATITIQNYFRLYKKLSGMTGTAATEAEEFSKIYNLDVTVIPTNKPVVRKDLPDRIYATEKGKLMAVVKEIKRLHEKGQPVLVGTISIEKNEFLSALLKREGIPHELLNAKNHQREAEIISQAGKINAVTVATNMAGRGVDIILGGFPFNEEEHNKVKEIGGLFVLGTERHEARRIDNQLRGRAGRQGDQGASQFYISMEDDLMRVFGSDRVKNLMQRLGVPEDQPIENKMVSKSIEKAQIRVEGNNFDIRKHLVEYDDVINKQREIIYKQRKEILLSAKDNPGYAKRAILDMVEDEIEQIVSFHTASGNQADWDLKEIAEAANTIFPLTAEDFDIIKSVEKIAGGKSEDAMARTKIIEFLSDKANARYAEFEKKVEEESGNGENAKIIEREILIRSMDNLWIEHLDALQSLRTGIGLRGYGQRDPLVEYKRETYDMFVQLQNLIHKQVVYSIFKVSFSFQPSQPAYLENARLNKDAVDAFNNPYKSVERSDAAPFINNNKVGRNDPCPCGSGKKYKQCCG